MTLVCPTYLLFPQLTLPMSPGSIIRHEPVPRDVLVAAAKPLEQHLLWLWRSNLALDGQGDCFPLNGAGHMKKNWAKVTLEGYPGLFSWNQIWPFGESVLTSFFTQALELSTFYVFRIFFPHFFLRFFVCLFKFLKNAHFCAFLALFAFFLVCYFFPAFFFAFFWCFFSS